MLIRCPTCESGVDVPAHLLTEGRIARCAYCRDAWVLRGAAAEPVSRERAITAEAHSSRRPATAIVPPRVARGRRRWSPRIGGSFAAATLVFGTVASGMTAVGQRDRIVSAFRPAAAVFAALGVPVNLRGLALSEFRSSVADADGAPTLAIDGTIANLRRQSTPLPAIRIAVRDATGRELYFWTVAAPKSRLAAGESVPFRSRLSAPPRDGETLAVSFVDAAPPTARHLAEASLAPR